MTQKAASYTPLESLLFFQSLRDEDLNAIDFGKISNELLALPMIQQDAGDDRDRLSASALQSLYLDLVKDATELPEASLKHGALSPGSRKRKSPSPFVPTIESAAKHRHLFPHLVVRLYARYRENVAAAIKEDESEIAELDKSIAADGADIGSPQDVAVGKATPVENGVGAHVNGDKAGTASSQMGQSSIPAPAQGGEPVPSTAGALEAASIDHPAEVPASNQASAASPLPSLERAPDQAMYPPSLPNQAPWPDNRQPSGQHISPHLKQVAPYPNHYQHPGHAGSPPAQHAPLHQPGSPNRHMLPVAGAPTQTPPIAQGSFHQRPQMQPPYASPGQGRSPVPAGRSYHPPPYQQYQQPPYQQYPHMQQYTAQQQYQIRPSQQGGFQLPPFQVAAQPAQQATPQRSQYPQSPRPAQSPYSASSPFSPLTPQQVRAAPDEELTRSVVATLRKRSSVSTWKSKDIPNISVPRSPARPPVEPISPIKPDLDLDMPDALEEKKTRRSKRGNSVASSAIASSARGRTRSQSVLSHNAEASNTKRSTRRSKAESTEPGQDDTAQQTRSTRRGTMLAPLLARASRPRERRDAVQATRNFARLSNVVLNEIAAHRHAGSFAKPVSNRDVDGYSDIVKRPQDLKSIKAAVTAGGRVVTAAAKAQAESAAEGDESADVNGATIPLPKTEAIVPPNGIVNSAQLEREVMRTFANAVMFNRGHDGMVKDARDMADDVAVSIAKWRGIEANAGGPSGGVDDDDGAGPGKRRRL